MLNRPPSPAPRQSRNAGGFTLIELLVAIGIVALLAGLLLAGVQSAISAAATARATNEIRNLETALAQFHSEFGMYPPSSIVLYETAAGWQGTDPATVRSKALIMKMWPQFNFNINRDINGDGNIGEPLVLNGAESLIFFLGGVIRERSGGTGPFVPIGFSRNPANPFDRTGSNRLGPFTEFVIERMVDVQGVDINGDPIQNGMPEYVDTYSGQQTPIYYLSSYDGRGYRAAELPAGMTDIYRQTAGAAGQPWKDKTYQLISPGADGRYGTGGHYNPSGGGTIGPDDRDNITNFSSGKLR